MRFWLDLGRRLARLPDRPSTLDCGLAARRKPRTVLSHRRRQPVCAHRLSTLAAFRECDVCHPTLVHPRQPRPVASATVLLLYIDNINSITLLMLAQLRWWRTTTIWENVWRKRRCRNGSFSTCLSVADTVSKIENLCLFHQENMVA